MLCDFHVAAKEEADVLLVCLLFFLLAICRIETSTFGHETGGHKLASLCKQLQVHILSIHPNGSTITPDPRTEIPAETRDFLVAWLTGDPRVRKRNGWFICVWGDKKIYVNWDNPLENNGEVC